MLHDRNGSLTVVQYQPHLAEYAWEVRRAVLDLRGKDFIIAVDLPHGLENQVLQAVKNLPKISIIIDILNRGIPVIPTSAPIEAVRSYLEFGHDLFFIDTSFPVCTTLEKWKNFQDKVTQYGLDLIVTNAEEMGIDLNAIMSIDSTEPPIPPVPFTDFPTATSLQSPVNNQNNQSYFSVRQRVMAMRLRNLLELGKPVLFICNQIHYSEVLRLLKEDIPGVTSDNIVIPAKTSRVSVCDIPLITQEIPYIMYLYEIFRDSPVNRESWIQKICSLAGDNEDVETILGVTGFSRKIALTRGRKCSDLASLLTASGYCTDEHYTEKIRKIALSYPFGDISTDSPMESHSDYNLQKLPDTQLNTEVPLKVPWKKLNLGRMKQTRKHTNRFYFEFTSKSKADLRNFYHHFLKTYRSSGEKDISGASQFISGFEEGIDIRETIRNFSQNQIYVRNQEHMNNASYVFYFGDKPGSYTTWITDVPIVGLTKIENNHYLFTHMVMFARPQPNGISYMDHLKASDPLISTLKLALLHSDEIFLFYDGEPSISLTPQEHKKIRQIPLSSVPSSVMSLTRALFSTKLRNK